MATGDGMRRDPNGYLSTRGMPDAKRPTDREVRTYATGRRCACGTLLSIYNPDEHCASCEPERWAEH